ADDQTDTLNRDLRQRQRPIDSVADAELRGIEIGVRLERNVNAIESETGLVDGAGSKGVCFADREDLPLAAARVAETWNGLSTLRCGLGPAVSLIRIVPVHGVITAKPVIDIQCELVVSYRSNTGAAKCARAAVRQRYQRQQLFHGRVGDRRPLS